MMILLLALLLAACGELPVDPVEEWPEWCAAESYQLEGQWTRPFRLRDHDYIDVLTLSSIDPCLLEYSVAMLAAAHDGAQASTVYQNRGRIVINGHTQDGPIHKFTATTHRTREQYLDSNGETVVNNAAAIYDQGELTLWGDSLKLWGNTYQRKENP